MLGLVLDEHVEQQRSSYSLPPLGVCKPACRRQEEEEEEEEEPSSTSHARWDSLNASLIPFMTDRV